MFRSLFRRELRETFFSFTFLSALAALTVLVPLSAYIQARYYRRMVEDYTLRQKIHRAENGVQSAVLSRPLPPLLPFFNGVLDRLPDEFRLRNDTATTDPLSGDLTPLDRLFPKVDLSFIVGVLLTLITILLAHGRIAREREQGTLKLILAGAVPRRTVLAAKLSGIVLPMAGALAYAIGLYVLVVSAFGGGTARLSAADLTRLAMSAAVALLALMVFAALGAIVSISVRHSSVALVACVSIWTVVVLIWPSFSPYIASAIKPVSTWEEARREIANKERELIRAELAEHKEAAKELKARDAGVEFAWREYLDLRRRWMEKRNKDIQDLNDKRDGQIRDQRHFATRLALISPYGAYKEVLGDFCDTGLESHDEFLAAVTQYNQQVFLPVSFDLLSRQKPWLGADAPDEPIQLQPFRAPSPSNSQRLAAAAWPLGLLFAELILFLLIGGLSFERYDVR
jgi:ABC-type transport system involved in multi-copper enzyme maturation permease subunit